MLAVCIAHALLVWYSRALSSNQEARTHGPPELMRGSEGAAVLTTGGLVPAVRSIGPAVFVCASAAAFNAFWTAAGPVKLAASTVTIRGPGAYPYIAQSAAARQ